MTILLIVFCLSWFSCGDDEEKKVLDPPEIASRLPLETGTFEYSKYYNFSFNEWETEGYGSSGEIYISDDYTTIEHTSFVYGGPSKDISDDGRKSGQSIICNWDSWEYYFAETIKGERVIVWHRFDDDAKCFYFIN